MAGGGSMSSLASQVRIMGSATTTTLASGVADPGLCVVVVVRGVIVHST